MTRDDLRHAVLDPDVRKQRIVVRNAGFRINAASLLQVAAKRSPDGAPTVDELDAAMRAAGAYRERSEYWLPMVSYRQLVRPEHAVDVPLRVAALCGLGAVGFGGLGVLGLVGAFAYSTEGIVLALLTATGAALLGWRALRDRA
jgi:hypothetical protein